MHVFLPSGQESGCKECQEGVNDNTRIESSKDTTAHIYSEAFDEKAMEVVIEVLTGPVS